jgi:hypothetical protein
MSTSAWTATASQVSVHGLINICTKRKKNAVGDDSNKSKFDSGGN